MLATAQGLLVVQGLTLDACYWILELKPQRSRCIVGDMISVLFFFVLCGGFFF